MTTIDELKKEINTRLIGARWGYEVTYDEYTPNGYPYTRNQ